MKPVVLLDSGPLGVLARKKSTANRAIWNWLDQMRAAGRRLILPDIADYEVRRELVRINATASIRVLDRLGLRLEYLPLTTAALRVAADPELDGDAILAAQAFCLGEPAVVATANVNHIARYVDADLWQNIVP